jgi:hypothetical protein
MKRLRFLIWLRPDYQKSLTPKSVTKGTLALMPGWQFGSSTFTLGSASQALARMLIRSSELQPHQLPL